MYHDTVGDAAAGSPVPVAVARRRRPVLPASSLTPPTTPARMRPGGRPTTTAPEPRPRTPCRTTSPTGLIYPYVENNRKVFQCPDGYDTTPGSPTQGQQFQVSYAFNFITGGPAGKAPRHHHQRNQQRPPRLGPQQRPRLLLSVPEYFHSGPLAVHRPRRRPALRPSSQPGLQRALVRRPRRRHDHQRPSTPPLLRQLTGRLAEPPSLSRLAASDGCSQGSLDSDPTRLL